MSTSYVFLHWDNIFMGTRAQVFQSLCASQLQNGFQKKTHKWQSDSMTLKDWVLGNANIIQHFDWWGLLVGGWTNPFEKYARQIESFPQGSGWKFQKIFELPPPSLFALPKKKKEPALDIRSPGAHLHLLTCWQVSVAALPCSQWQEHYVKQSLKQWLAAWVGRC